MKSRWFLNLLPEVCDLSLEDDKKYSELKRVIRERIMTVKKVMNLSQFKEVLIVKRSSFKIRQIFAHLSIAESLSVRLDSKLHNHNYSR